jgi:hypothetical protein
MPRATTANRRICAVLSVLVGLGWGGVLISNELRFVGVLFVLIGVALALFALSGSDRAFEKFPWWIGW